MTDKNWMPFSQVFCCLLYKFITLFLRLFRSNCTCVWCKNKFHAEIFWNAETVTASAKLSLANCRAYSNPLKRFWHFLSYIFLRHNEHKKISQIMKLIMIISQIRMIEFNSFSSSITEEKELYLSLRKKNCSSKKNF